MTLALGSALARTASELANGYMVTVARPGSARLRDRQVGGVQLGLVLALDLDLDGRALEAGGLERDRLAQDLPPCGHW